MCRVIEVWCIYLYAPWAHKIETKIWENQNEIDTDAAAPGAAASAAASRETTVKTVVKPGAAAEAAAPGAAASVLISFWFCYIFVSIGFIFVYILEN